MKLIRFIVAWCVLFACGGLSAALVTLTNLNVLYFRVDADPTAVVTNVVLLNGNLTNWFKLSTNVIIIVNPTSTYVPYNNAGVFDDSWFYRIANGMGINTNLYFGPGTTNILYRFGTAFIFASGSATNAFRISETMWDDSMVPEALVRVGATAPTQASFNGGPGQTLQFQNNRDDAVTASVQISHRYRQGTSVYPHVHWSETATTGAGTNVVWELQYTWANPDTGVFPLYNTLLMTNSVSGTNWLHSMESFPAISGTGKQVSAVMVFQLRRLANSATADDYDQNVAFLGFDLHYQVDSPGSDSAISKSF